MIATHIVMYAGDLLVAVAILFASLGIGGSLVALLAISSDDPIEGLAVPIVGLGVTSVVLFGIGVLGLLDRASLEAVLLIGAILAIAVPANRQLIRGLARQSAEARRAISRDAVAIVFVVSALGSTLFAVVTNALVPPHDWDTLMYHLAIPAIYLMNHRIVYLPSVFESNWPLSTEMLYLFALAIGSARVAGLVTIAYLLIGELAVLFLGLRFAGPRAGALAAAFFAGMPIVWQYAGTAEVDIPLGVISLLAVAVAIDGWEQRRRQYLVLAGLLAGIAAGTKQSGMLAGLLIGIGLITLAAIRRERATLSLVAWFILPCAVLAAPWYMKSWIVTGNPVWPFLASIFPSRNWDSYGTMLQLSWLYHYGVGRSLAALVALPWDLAQTNRVGPSVGPLVVLALPFAFFARKQRQQVVGIALFCLAWTGVWFFALTQQERLLSPVLPSAALLASLGVSWAWRVAPGFGKPLLSLGLIGWIIFTSPLAQRPEQNVFAAALANIRGQVSDSAFAANHIDVYPVFSYANAHLSPQSYVLLLLYENRGFDLRVPYFWGNPVGQRTIKFEQIRTSAGLAAILKQMGFTNVIINPKLDLPNVVGDKHFVQLVDAYRQRYLVPQFTANGVTLYRIKD